jgi:hypothetical protein
MSKIVPIPTRMPLFAEPAGRAGDWWEPTGVCAAEVATGLRVEVDRHRLPVDLLAALLVEHALVESDIAACAVEDACARTALNDAARAKPTLGPGCLHTSYVRMLGMGEYDYEREGDEQLARRDLHLPLRLHDAVRTVDLEEVWNSEVVDEAIAWEIAAASRGQFMREWSLRTLLVSFAA